MGSGAGLVFYFRYEKARMERKRVAEAAKGVGRPKVGGAFDLVDQDGKAFTDKDMRGKYSLVSAYALVEQITGKSNHERTYGVVSGCSY